MHRVWVFFVVAASGLGPGIAVHADAPTRKSDSRTVSLFYWSNRRVETDARKGPVFYASLGHPHCGRVRLSVPSARKKGVREQPGLFEREDRDRHFSVLEVSLTEESDFFEEIRSQLLKEAKQELLLFVHGTNSPFERAATRTAQLAVDLNYRGPVVFFAWPSESGLLAGSYLADKQSLAASIPAFSAFLETMSQRLPNAKINILAHSLGCQLVACSLTSLSTTPHPKPLLKEVIFAAPDIDAVAFEKVHLEAMGSMLERLTVYVSSRDGLLEISRKANWGRPRLGQQRPTAINHPKVETIDVSSADSTAGFLSTGHRYYADSPSVLQDQALLLRGVTNSARQTCAPRREEHGRHFALTDK